MLGKLDVGDGHVVVVLDTLLGQNVEWAPLPATVVIPSPVTTAERWGNLKQ